jgi:Ser/Thr protein kinase RdoA (MazF antagonist)
VLSLENEDMLYDGNDYYRLFPFVKDSLTYTTLENPELAFEAAKQFGKFTHLLSDFDTTVLKETLPNFHNLTLRYNQFQESLLKGNKDRLTEAAACIEQIESYKYIVDEFEKIKSNSDFKIRVMHHDTKISNVLFDNKNKGLCVIDLDTVMPGYFISDVGDMMRTYLSPVSEEEKDFTKIEIREEYFDAIVAGYLGEMKADMSPAEVDSFVYAGKFMIYMQAVRFLADYLNNDVYYRSKYEGHNFVRAKNQLYLLQMLNEKENMLMKRSSRV